MNRYEIIIFWSNEDQAFIADVPELAHESALAAAKEAMSLWLEVAQATGRLIPQARGERLHFA